MCCLVFLSISHLLSAISLLFFFGIFSNILAYYELILSTDFDFISIASWTDIYFYLCFFINFSLLLYNLFYGFFIYFDLKFILCLDLLLDLLGLLSKYCLLKDKVFWENELVRFLELLLVWVCFFPWIILPFSFIAWVFWLSVSFFIIAVNLLLY